MVVFCFNSFSVLMSYNALEKHLINCFITHKFLELFLHTQVMVNFTKSSIVNTLGRRFSFKVPWCENYVNLFLVFISIHKIEHRPHGTAREVPILPRTESTSEFMPVDDKEVEYFFASDASAVIEHTNRVIYLEVSFCLTATSFSNKF